MNYGVQPSGFIAKRFEDIISDISTKINNKFDINIDANPDNKLKTIVNILALPLAENWEVCQALSGQFDLDQASDIFLDYLCAGKLIYRQDGIQSSGDVSIEIAYDNTLTLPEQSSFYNKVNQEFQTTVSTTLDNGQIHKCILDFDPATTVTSINVELNGATFTASIATEGSYANALTKFKQLVENAGYTMIQVSGNLWQIYKIGSPVAETETFSVNIVSGVEPTTSRIFKSFSVQYVEEGDFVFPAESFTVAPSFSAILSYTNTAIVGGRYRETDEELRYRFKTSPSVVGKATPAAIKSTLSDLVGVTDVALVVNNTMTTFPEGNPPKSVEVVVKGGEDSDIAARLYDYAGAGIELYGNTTVQTVDVNNEPTSVDFSRIESLYITARVTYTKYDEEEFPSDGNITMRDITVDYINNLNIGTDVIGGRIGANIYRNIGGVENITVEMFGNTDVNGSGTYSTQPVRVSRKQEAITSLDKIIIQEA